MSEPSIVPYVKTTPKPFGVDVEWKWPGGCLWLELQYLHEDGRLVKEIIHWPAINYLISGLKAGERLQLRLRPLPVGQDGSARDWRAGDWIEGVSSVDTEEIIEALDEEIRSSKAFEKLINGTPIHCQVHITDTMIGDAAVSANYIVKMNVNHGGKLHVAGMAGCIEGDQRKVVFEADRFKVNEAASSIIENAVATSAKMKIRLSDEMKQAVIDAVRESDLFTSLQAASASDLQQAVDDAVGKALRNAVKPGGMIWSSFQLCQH
ncbi:hypothetical protein B9Q37_20545 [Enterobacter kobei]|uniref:Tip attachment protein J central straight fiber domain-containing protein n=1 Tax=Enterobacter kobei TaxID=208224 RepID=A0A2J0PEG2_9ENTR|nr:DUF1983 domain-containing protein [Enterobacter kobei]PJD65974.1 hypothetical protein B9Q29_17500 [Enterobacter kobei]PJD69462.1 hypothetical protein B9Q37_20545 [Enterobacter kobei]